MDLDFSDYRNNVVLNSSKEKDENFFEEFLKRNEIIIKGSSLKNVAKIMAALEWEFQIQGDGFPKHYSDDYLDQSNLAGLTWQELTGLNKDTFRAAFHKIGITYNSIEEFEHARNSEQEFGKLFYCRVKTSYQHRTFYYRSNLIDSLIKNFRESLINDSNN